MAATRPTPYKALADELEATRHPYRVWPHHKVGDPCNDCGQVPGAIAHRHLEYVLYEAGLRSAEETFDPLRGYWNPAEAQAAFAKRVAAKAEVRAEAKDRRQVKEEEAGATSWTSRRRSKSSS